jgi:hypothetical protein
MLIHHSKNAFFPSLKRYMTCHAIYWQKARTKSKESVAQTASQPFVYAKGLNKENTVPCISYVIKIWITTNISGTVRKNHFQLLSHNRPTSLPHALISSIVKNGFMLLSS